MHELQNDMHSRRVNTKSIDRNRQIVRDLLAYLLDCGRATQRELGERFGGHKGTFSMDRVIDYNTVLCEGGNRYRFVVERSVNREIIWSIRKKG